jgi:alkylated DNA repair dioxygenase AlkB
MSTTNRAEGPILGGVSLPAGFIYERAIFDAPAAAAHLAGLLVEIAWERYEFRIYGRAVPMPRLIAMYGPVGYRYSGVEHRPSPLPPRVAAIRDHVETVTGRRFNSVLLNLYQDGHDSVGWHRDNDYPHGGQPDIGSVSFGATRRFQLRDGTGGRAEIALEDGSVLLMTGDAIRRWWHRVPKTAQPVGPRVNLTFRHMVSAR